jgi:AcrR family transcriptional regulator
MTPDERRRQLLGLGAQLFASTAYEDVHIETVAEMAQVSRGLLYHYFPTKRAFFVELLTRASAQLMTATAPDPDLPMTAHLNRGIEAYLDHCATHRFAAQAIHRGSASGDPQVQELIARNTAQQAARIVSVLVPDGDPPALLRIAVSSWILFLRTACQEWLAAPGVARDDVRDVCAAALAGAILGLPEHSRPPTSTMLLAELTLAREAT